MRPAYIWSISALAHVALLLLGFAILATPTLLATVPPDAIAVDIVRPDEIGAGRQDGTGPAAAPGTPAAQPSNPAAPTYASLFPWPVPVADTDKQIGDYRTFESTSEASPDELAPFKARLMTCWTPIAGAAKLTASLRVALRADGTLAGPPELVEATASPDGPALVQGALRALRQCEPYGGLPADKYASWKALSLTFSPHGVAVAAISK